ncbi:mRNA decay activator protein ZFP36L1-like [Ambystoma mexicanum]|uniref:mRNA decay activator protein ZFP36L1-like n=1 Tax=Ambystoma mexicanum TaxID=8296 RepID=UPI0037E7E5A8
MSEEESGQSIKSHKATREGRPPAVSLQSSFGGQEGLVHQAELATMPSDMLSPFLELDMDLCKDFLKLSMLEDPISLAKSFRETSGVFQRALSACPAALSSTDRTGGSNSMDHLNDSSPWPLHSHWTREAELPRTSLLHSIPFRVDRSVSMIESPCMPPPGLSLPTTPGLSSRYKTEQCRTYRENATCKYGSKCQFAHGPEELRGLSRHPKYKTELCRTFHTIGFCPYGARCHFIHNAEEQRFSSSSRPPLLRQSLSFAGVSSTSSFSEHLNLQDPLHFSRASSTSPPPSTSQSPRLHSPVFPDAQGFSSSSEDPLGSHVGAPPRFFSTTLSGRESGGPAHMSGCFGGANTSFFSSRSSDAVTPADLLQTLKGRNAFSFPSLPLKLCRSPSRDSLSDQEQDGYSSSGGSSSSGSESPGCDATGRRLPIFSRISFPDD